MTVINPVLHGRRPRHATPRIGYLTILTTTALRNIERITTPLSVRPHTTPSLVIPTPDHTHLPTQWARMVQIKFSSINNCSSREIPARQMITSLCGTGAKSIVTSITKPACFVIHSTPGSMGAVLVNQLKLVVHSDLRTLVILGISLSRSRVHKPCDFQSIKRSYAANNNSTMRSLMFITTTPSSCGQRQDYFCHLTSPPQLHAYHSHVPLCNKQGSLQAYHQSVDKLLSEQRPIDLDHPSSGQPYSA